MKEKLQKKGGFTLVEMLIVVAIIAILIAVSLPLVSSNLEKAREAVDDANRRSALSLGMTYYLSNMDDADINNATTGKTMYYEVDLGSDSGDGNYQGSLIDDPPATGYGKSKTNNGKYIKVVIKAADGDDSVVTATWDGPKGGADGNDEAKEGE